MYSAQTMTPAPGALANQGTMGLAYTQTFVATIAPPFNTGLVSYAITAGSVPIAGGLTLNAATGNLSGTPTAAGAFAFDITATLDYTGAGNFCDTTFSYTLHGEKERHGGGGDLQRGHFRIPGGTSASFTVTVTPKYSGAGTPTGTAQFR